MLIEKDNLIIRNAIAADAPLLGSWWRDGMVMAHAGFPNGLSITDDEIIKDLAACADDTGRVLIIEVDSVPIGEMNYRNIDGNTAEIGIKICVATQQEKGYGSKLITMLLDELFCNHGYLKIILDTNLENKRAQRVYENLAFGKVGIKYNSWKNQLGVLQSAVDYEMSRDDYFSHKAGMTDKTGWEPENRKYFDDIVDVHDKRRSECHLLPMEVCGL